MKKANYSLPNIKPPKKDKAFDVLSKSNLGSNNKLKKDPFDSLKKSSSDVGQPRKPRQASRTSVKQFKAK